MSQQLVQGYMTFGALIRYWRGRSRLSGAQLEAIADWGLGERGWLNTGVLSRIERATQTRGCGLKHLLAFDAANAAIHTWQVRGRQEAWARFGPHTVWGVRDEWLDEAIWLPAPDHPDEAMEFADFAEVLVGRMEVPYLGNVVLRDGDAEAMSSRLSDLLNEAIGDRGLSPRQAMKTLLAAYPTKDSDRQSRLIALVMGSGGLSRDELEAELYAVSEALRDLRGLTPGSYGPGDLAAELSSDLLGSE